MSLSTRLKREGKKARLGNVCFTLTGIQGSCAVIDKKDWLWKDNSLQDKDEFGVSGLKELHSFTYIFLEEGVIVRGRHHFSLLFPAFEMNKSKSGKRGEWDVFTSLASQPWKCQRIRFVYFSLPKNREEKLRVTALQAGFCCDRHWIYMSRQAWRKTRMRMVPTDWKHQPTPPKKYQAFSPLNGFPENVSFSKINLSLRSPALPTCHQSFERTWGMECQSLSSLGPLLQADNWQPKTFSFSFFLLRKGEKRRKQWPAARLDRTWQDNLHRS